MKHYKKLEEFLKSELDDYSYFKWEINFEEAEDDDEEYYTVDFRIADAKLPNKTLRFKVTTDGIEIDTSEDHWEKVTTWDYHVKYFWMTLLSWEI